MSVRWLIVCSLNVAAWPVSWLIFVCSFIRMSRDAAARLSGG